MGFGCYDDVAMPATMTSSRRLLHLSCAAVLLLLMTPTPVTSQTPPAGCFYTSATPHTYECDLRFAKPINYNNFQSSYRPQHLIVYNVDEQVDSTSFTNFNR